MVGWAREEWRVRCDDVLAVTAQPSVSIAVPSRDGLSDCRPGEWLALGRYPRKVWEAPDRGRFVFTTQQAIHTTFEPSALPNRISGVICSSAGAAAPDCLLSYGKAHNILDDPSHDRLLVGVMSGLDGRSGGLVAVPRDAPLRELARVLLPQSGSMYDDPELDMLGVFGDQGRILEMVRASDLRVLDPAVPANLMGPDFVRYDPARHEGVACSGNGPLRTLGGQAFIAVGFRGAPFAPRPLAPSSKYPSSWLALSWGCDWDRAQGKVYAAVSTLGQLVTIGMDTGEVISRSFVGFGIRSVTFDAPRNRLYLGNFLRGDVLEFDPVRGEVTRRWLAGRYVRDVELSPDGLALVVTSNLGIVRIDLNN